MNVEDTKTWKVLTMIQVIESGNNLSTSDFESDEENISSGDIEKITEEAERSYSESSNNGVSELFMVADDAEEYEYFTTFFDINIMHVIVNETNRYCEYRTRDRNDGTRSKTKIS
ncbi:hypothetical protein AVEN_10378-1 [Araneus ventricosus]|uniref:PiggyBac transposable element-derived protein domain-containing protein n=1 Tax=Araneus ventricosus TaxID=182803 RepID=A0A4Y2GZ33_ARAVE|nr:hypothetical protein AVEN_10378-1 [Araneus ventricosus]